MAYYRCGKRQVEDDVWLYDTAFLTNGSFVKVPGYLVTDYIYVGADHTRYRSYGLKYAEGYAFQLDYDANKNRVDYWQIHSGSINTDINRNAVYVRMCIKESDYDKCFVEVRGEKVFDGAMHPPRR